MPEIIHKYTVGPTDFYWKIVDDIMLAAERLVHEMIDQREHSVGFTGGELKNKNTKLQELSDAHKAHLKENVERIAQQAFDKGRQFERAIRNMPQED